MLTPEEMNDARRQEETDRERSSGSQERSEYAEWWEQATQSGGESITQKIERVVQEAVRDRSSGPERRFYARPDGVVIPVYRGHRIPHFFSPDNHLGAVEV